MEEKKSITGRVTTLEISQQAQNDLEDIYLYSLQEHGELFADNYMGRLDQAIKSLLQHPKQGQNQSIIRTGIRRMVTSHHAIYYRITHDTIRLLRILHQSRDPGRHL
ncbi:MAG TPA: hypothetical protein DE179_07750 [Oceanospirillaceae bacterium]|nr:hypothetical protein [Oceanospirillaceae bacterium]